MTSRIVAPRAYAPPTTAWASNGPQRLWPQPAGKPVAAAELAQVAVDAGRCQRFAGFHGVTIATGFEAAALGQVHDLGIDIVGGDGGPGRREADTVVAADGVVLLVRRLKRIAWLRARHSEPGECRRPTLTWPRQIPLEGEPADEHIFALLAEEYFAG